MTAVISQNTLDWVRDARAEQLRRKRARSPESGQNMPNAVRDVSVAFPWMRELREVSPVTALHSYLLPYWYRVKERWVLYDALPVHLLPDDDTPLGSMITGKEFFEIMRGVRPSEREDFKDLVQWPISDVQHEMYRLHQVYARPFWVLQGPGGGHQVGFSPEQAQHLVAMGFGDRPPAIGSLAPCPFDNRAAKQLQHMNRLHQMEDSMQKLRESGSRDYIDQETAAWQTKVRLAECAFIEAQMTPLVDMSNSLVRGPNTRSEHMDQIVRVKSGAAAEAKDAYEAYKATGDYSATFKDLTGLKR